MRVSRETHYAQILYSVKADVTGFDHILLTNLNIYTNT